jgi:hypothetical protein
LIAAGPWSFPAPSSALPVTRRALEGPDRAPSSSRCALRRLGSSPSTLVFAPLQSFTDSPRSVLRPYLSWDSSSAAPVRTSLSARAPTDPFSPSSTCSLASTPSASPRLRSWVNQTPDPVPTPWFRTTSPVFSAFCAEAHGPCGPRVAGLLHPAADRGVHRVSWLILLLPAGWSAPRDGCTPRRIPLAHSRSVSPRPVAFLTLTSSRCSHLQGSRCRYPPSARLLRRSSTPRLCSVASPYPDTPFPTQPGPTLPWASVSPSRSLRSRDLGGCPCHTMDGRTASAAPFPSRRPPLPRVSPPRLVPTGP